MFGNKTREELIEIKEWMRNVQKSLNEIHCKFFQRSPQCKCKSSFCMKGCEDESKESILEDLKGEIEEIKETLKDFFDTTQENSSINRIHEKLDIILTDEKRLEKVSFGLAACEKFDKYMKNVDKLNAMVNEIKGIAAMTRANLKETKST